MVWMSVSGMFCTLWLNNLVSYNGGRYCYRLGYCSNTYVWLGPTSGTSGHGLLSSRAHYEFLLLLSRFFVLLHGEDRHSVA